MKAKKAAAFLISGALLASGILSGCGNKINQNETLITIDDQTVTLGYGNFVARYNQVNYDGFLSAYYGEGYWTSDQYADEDGKTMQDSVKEYILEEIEQGYLLEAHMSEYGVEITDEDRAAIEAAAAKFMEDNTSSAAKKLGATQEYVEDYLYYQTVTDRMTEAIRDTADTEVSDEECRRRTFSYIQIDLDGHTDETTGEYVTYTDEERQAVEENAEVVATLAKSDFEAAAESYSYTVSSYSYGSDESDESEGGFDNAAIAAADALSEGEISGVVKGADCIYIIRLDSEDDAKAAEEAREDIIENRKNDHFTEVTDGYKEAANIEVNEEAWAGVVFTDLFTIAQEQDDLSAPEE